MVRTIAMTKYLGAKLKKPQMLLCYNYYNGITDEEEDIIFVIKPKLFSIGTISLLDTFQFIGTTEFNHISIKVKNHSTKLSSTKSISIEGKMINRYELVVASYKKKCIKKCLINTNHGMFK